MNVPCVTLIGLPGTGKSECGKLTAELLGWSFADADKWIESAYGATVADLFSREGEPFFRELERLTLQRLASPTLDLNNSDRSNLTDESAEPRNVINRLVEVVEQSKQDAEAKGGLILATGGGMPVPSYNQNKIRELGLSFYLACDLNVLSQRLSGDCTRPLLQSANNFDRNGKADTGDKNSAGSQNDATGDRAINATRKRLQELLDARRTAYGIAGDEIDTTFMTTAEVADKLKESILAKINM